MRTPLVLSRFHWMKLVFASAAFASLGLSVSLWFTGHRDAGVFVGLWVPAIHSLGTLVLTGEDRSAVERRSTSSSCQVAPIRPGERPTTADRPA